jgi:hypothetical protein
VHIDANQFMQGDTKMALQPATLVWPGWIGTMPADDTQYRLTWDEWRTRQRQHPQQGPAHNAAHPPERRDIAARAFLVWFDTTGSDRQTPPFDDRELAVRRFMRSFHEVATTQGQFSGTELARLRLLRRRHQTG